MSGPGSLTLRTALEVNKHLASQTSLLNPNFFTNLAKSQAPKILWLGCSDSRVSEITITGGKPGDIFTHRNIANVVSPDDDSLNAVIQFAVGSLGVSDVVLCGHTQCGGCKGVLGQELSGPLAKWLKPLDATREKHADELAKVKTEEQAEALSKFNVKAGLEVLRQNEFVKKRTDLALHGLLYRLETGELERVE